VTDLIIDQSTPAVSSGGQRASSQGQASKTEVNWIGF
jgi:hypothetical protein